MNTITVPKPLAAAELRAWRNRLNWTQREAAERLGIPRRTLEAWEHGQRCVLPGPVQLAMRLLEMQHSNLDFLKA